MTTERIQALRLITEEFDERWAMADVADAQYEKLLAGLIEWLKEKGVEMQPKESKTPAAHLSAGYVIACSEIASKLRQALAPNEEARVAASE